MTQAKELAGERLAAEPIQSPDAFRELCGAWAQNEREADKLAADRDKAIQALREKFDPQIAERRQIQSLIGSRVEEYAQAHREEILSGERKGAKSTIVGGVKVAWTSTAGGVETPKGKDGQAILDRCAKSKNPLIRKLTKVAISWTFDKKAAEAVKPNQLEKLGFTIKEPGETFAITPAPSR